LHEADEQDLHRDERPGDTGDDDRLAVEAGQPVLAEDLLHVPHTRRCNFGY
jgi:hypothetical protein